MYFVNIIRSQRDNTLYTGLTKDLKRRLVEHNTGDSGYTKSKLPF
ncbi:MAG: GIY-YIG nuclease family protein [Candidatus Magasanikbacteria bacterium]|nr:GIY-YIG nuclease family protein [Candidatus Magasanikbacteria bacterium]